MKFFKLTPASFRQSVAWASGYGPVADLSFLAPVFLERRRAFWTVNPTPPGLEIDPGGRTWPDVLGCGHAPPSFFLSQRVVDSLRRIGAPIGGLTEMTIGTIYARTLQKVPPPRYYVVQSVPGIAVDFVASHIPTDAQGLPILTPLPKPWPPTIVLREETWNGSDLISYANYGAPPHLTLLCTERIKALAEREWWTNVEFRPVLAH